MNTMTFKVIVLALGLVGAGSALADTPLKLGSELIRIEGVSRPSTLVSAIVFYTPLYKFDKKVSSQGCQFKEDHWKPNENDMSVTVKAQRTSGGYSLPIPTQATRGTCAYVLESLSLSVEDKPTGENLTILTERQIKRMDAELSEVGGIEPVKSLNELNGLYCEFHTEYETGFCYPAQDTIATFYGISNSAAIYTLDIKDVSERPERQY